MTDSNTNKKGSLAQIRQAITDRQVIEGVDFRHLSFESLDLTGAHFIHCLFDACLFQQCNLSKVFLTECRMEGAQFIDNQYRSAQLVKCDLNNSQWQGEVYKLNLSDCALKKSVWTQATLTFCAFNLGDLSAAQFHHCDWLTVSISQVVMEGTQFQHNQFGKMSWMDTDFTQIELQNCQFKRVLLLKCDLSGLDFSGSVFQNCTCSGSRLVKTCFYQATVNNCNFSSSELEHVDFRQAKLMKSLFSKSVLAHCQFDGADLDNGKFTKAQLQSCSLVGCNLAQSSFKQASMVKVDFSRCQLTYANLSYATLKQCCFNYCELNHTNKHALEDEDSQWKGVNKSGFLAADQQQIEMDEYLKTYG